MTGRWLLLLLVLAALLVSLHGTPCEMSPQNGQVTPYGLPSGEQPRTYNERMV